MQKMWMLLICAGIVGLSGCSNVCNSVGQTPGSFSGGSGWTGIANIGITGIHAGICGTGVLIDKAKSSDTASSSEPSEKKLARSIADQDLLEQQERIRAAAQAENEKGN